jgi:hypothetical protein
LLLSKLFFKNFFIFAVYFFIVLMPCDYEKTLVVFNIARRYDGDNFSRLHRGTSVYDEFCGRWHITAHRVGAQRHLVWTFGSRRLESSDFQFVGVSGVACYAYARI